MGALLNSFLLVFFSEMGDKTQLLSLLLVARYKKRGAILAGVFVATILNHAVASAAGNWLAGLLSPVFLKWTLVLFFLGFAFWVLIPDKEGDVPIKGTYGVFLTTTVAFFLAEMGDKTQLATVALGAKYSDVMFVTLGSTLGMLLSNALAVFWGERLLSVVPMKWIRVLASVLFIFFAIVVAMR
ncbi:MAG: TMEM165/GDT1 family protein [Bdellovibrionaceae bacterium]|nr:TMEM165/GDT1 family protein [Pseudobdellovibrionaceae bacterium]